MELRLHKLKKTVGYHPNDLNEVILIGNTKALEYELKCEFRIAHGYALVWV